MTDVFAQPDDNGPAKASEATVPLSERLGAQAADTLDPQDSLSGMQLYRRVREGIAGGFAPHDWDGGVDAATAMQLDSIGQKATAAIPDISQDDARLMLKQEGLTESDVPLGDAVSHKLPVLKLRIDEAHTRRDRQAAIERGPQGFFPEALGTITSLGVGMIDPVNIAAFSIPVIGEARMGKMLASAGDSILARGAVRAAQGAAQGAVGTAALQPADWWLHTNDGRDYTMAQALNSVVMGAGVGGAFHAGFGAVGDIRSRMRGDLLPGSPQDLLARGLLTGTHVPAAALADEGVPLEEVPGIGSGTLAPLAETFPGDLPSHPADVLADLPDAAKRDAVHSAMADIISGRPTQAAEMLNISADHDPRIAESFEAWHGSAHDFDSFDSSKINTGEGAQSYGHGLYFAQNEKVARGYQRAVSDKVFIDKVSQLYDEHSSPDEAWSEIQDHWTEFSSNEQRLMTALHGDDWLGFDYPHQAVSAALSPRASTRWEMAPETEAAARSMGNMYRVKIKASHEHFLDWDKPLGEQSDHVRNALLHHPDPAISGTAEKWGHSVASLYGRLRQRLAEDEPYDAGATKTSRTLADAGIPGIKYLDQGSRGDGEGTRNFVVFEDKHIEITHKNGEPVKKEDLAAEHQARQESKKSARGRAAADPRTWSLFEYLASRGGLKPDADLEATFGNKRGPFVPGFGPLLRKTGMSMDDALIAAKEGGYFIDPTSQEHVQLRNADMAALQQPATFGLRDLMEKIDEESRGRRQYRDGHQQATKYDPAHESHVVMSELEHELEKSGAKVEDIDPALLDRTVEIVKRDGETDVLAAYERAIMEDAERYDAITHQRQTDQEPIPGWDAADGRAASGDVGPGIEDRGQAGRSDSGARPADGPQSPGAGVRTRSSHAVAAADPRWRELADTIPDFDQPDVIAESEAAAREPEPASVNPSKSLTALDKALADADEVWRKLEPTLTDEERASVNEAFTTLGVNKTSRDRIIIDGAACLAGAVI